VLDDLWLPRIRFLALCLLFASGRLDLGLEVPRFASAICGYGLGPQLITIVLERAQINT
jgi:hypothetical protein